ncbi:hypothetical protein TL16_g00504 [Triparma laevis f. inornata]|uniref:Uncharacterized protein n=1 Tax=Triparma laevis f. inornata TaxID=1714386 RepID=A0A9W6ZBW2_9STRA|nr:hypothetical protein TL16_g00504 [Triparma laevis f. inornata]
MFNSVATWFSIRLKTQEISRKRGREDEEKEDGEEQNEGSAADNSTISTTVSTDPAATDQFMHTPEFRRHFVDFVHLQTLVALRVATKGWNAAADALIDEGLASGQLMVHCGEDSSGRLNMAQMERRKLVTRVIFLLNVTKVGENTCWYAVNLVVVDIPEGVESIGEYAFQSCHSLTTASFPTTLIAIGHCALRFCSSLDNVDLLHTNLQQFGDYAFSNCSELKSMTIPDSLQTLSEYSFEGSHKLVPFNINGYNDNINNLVVAYLRDQQRIAPAPAPVDDCTASSKKV